MILLRVSDSINCPIPACFVVGIFSFSLCVGVAQLVSWFLLEWIAPCIAVHLVCPSEERNLEVSSVAIWLTPWRALKFNWPWCDLFLLLIWMFSVWVSLKIRINFYFLVGFSEKLNALQMPFNVQWGYIPTNPF